MKVLREGPPWERKHECEKCRSLLLLDEKDVMYIRKYEERGLVCPSCNSYYYFVCPKCAIRNRLDASELPEHVKADAFQEFTKSEAYELG